MKKYYLVQWKCEDVITNHGFFQTPEEALDSIFAWWDLNEFSVPYLRSIYNEDGVQAIDYGSHIAFYYIIPVSRENYAHYLNGGLSAKGMSI